MFRRVAPLDSEGHANEALRRLSGRAVAAARRAAMQR